MLAKTKVCVRANKNPLPAATSRGKKSLITAIQLIFEKGDASISTIKV